MTVLLVGAALVAVVGAVATLAPVNPRVGLLGLTVALAAAAVIGDPLPGPSILAVRVSAALLAVVILRAATAIGSVADAGSGWSAGGRPRRGSGPWLGAAGGEAAPPHIGWAPTLALAAAGAGAGLMIGIQVPAAGTATSLVGLPELRLAGVALAVGGAMVVLGAGPALLAGIGLRRALAAVLLTAGLEVVRIGLGTRPDELEEIVVAATLVAVATAGAALIAFAARSNTALHTVGGGDAELSGDPTGADA